MDTPDEYLTHAVVVKAYVWRDSKLLILKRRADDDEMAGYWDIPGGRLGRSESARDGLAREVKEETGLTFTRARLATSWDYAVPGKGHALGLSFVVHDAEGEVALSPEHSAYRWIAAADVEGFAFHDNLKKEILWIIGRGWAS